MNKIIASVKLRGLFGYLFQRAHMRFFSAKTSNSTQIIYGQSVDLDLRDLEQKYLSEDCVREPENLFVYQALNESGLADTFIDIGANCGHVASSVASTYQNIVLFEPNPKLAALLRQIFTNYQNVSIKECAIVSPESIGSISLTVPVESSGLATLGGTHLSNEREAVNTYQVRAATLESETLDVDLKKAYLKIDVEGYEYDVISSAIALIQRSRPIVGFEALSFEAAQKCCSLFQDCKFYCARFDFLEKGGALTNSAVNIARSVLAGGSIEVIEINPLSANVLDNFSQVFAVPQEKAIEFERALQKKAAIGAGFNLSSLRTWSTK